MLSLGARVSRTCAGPTRPQLFASGGVVDTWIDVERPEPSGGGAATTTASAGGERAVILLMLVGGPSQLETWDPKPEAPGGGPRTFRVDRHGGARRADLRAPAPHGAADGARHADSINASRRRPDSRDRPPTPPDGAALCETGAEAPHLGSVVAGCEVAGTTCRRSSFSRGRLATPAWAFRTGSRRDFSGRPTNRST